MSSSSSSAIRLPNELLCELSNSVPIDAKIVRSVPPSAALASYLASQRAKWVQYFVRKESRDEFLVELCKELLNQHLADDYERCQPWLDDPDHPTDPDPVCVKMLEDEKETIRQFKMPLCERMFRAELAELRARDPQENGQEVQAAPWLFRMEECQSSRQLMLLFNWAFNIPVAFVPIGFH